MEKITAAKNIQSQVSLTEFSLSQASVIWNKTFKNILSLFETSIDTPWGPVKSYVHTLGLGEDNINLLPFDDTRGELQPELVEHFGPGEVGISIKHHSPNPDVNTKEVMKFQATHIQIVVGTENGVITVNNPPGYCNGGFGPPDYPSIFIKPRYPNSLSIKQKKMYQDNIRTWLVLLNAFSEFPGNYNGSDPLKCISLESILEFGKSIIKAASGDQEAVAWLKMPDQKLYCAELAHVAFNLGLYYPLNQQHIGSEFQELAHTLTTKSFLAEHENPHIHKIKLVIAPPELLPLNSVLSIPETNEHFWDGLAIKPFSTANIVIEFLRRSVTRSILGETKGSTIQSALLRKMHTELTQVLNLSTLETKKQFEILMNEVDMIVSTAYLDYNDFCNHFDPMISKLEHFSLEHGLSYIPPHCFLLRAYDSINYKKDLGVLGWTYVGHGFHQKLFKMKGV